MPNCRACQNEFPEGGLKPVLHEDDLWCEDCLSKRKVVKVTLASAMKSPIKGTFYLSPKIFEKSGYKVKHQLHEV
jgi:hypothetical protein